MNMRTKNTTHAMDDMASSLDQLVLAAKQVIQADAKLQRIATNRSKSRDETKHYEKNNPLKEPGITNNVQNHTERG